MTTEQNETQAQPSQGQTQAQGPNAGQNQGHRRRRRKRNKGQGKQPVAAAQQNGQGPQAPPPQAAAPQHQSQPQAQKPRPQKRFFQKNSNYGNGNGGNGNGNGRMQGSSNANGGGARRKGKQRRQQVFVGPMDHSYRVANGNIADSGGVNNFQAEFRGMPHSGFYPESDFYNSATAAPMREDAPVRIYFFIEDLFFVAKIQEVSKKLGVKVGFLKAGKETLAQLTDAAEDARPSLIVFDLNNANVKPLTMIPKIKAKLKRGTSVIGFLSHLQGDLKVKAIEAGCDMVMPRSAFSQNLPNLLRRHGLEEEMETLEA